MRRSGLGFALLLAAVPALSCLSCATGKASRMGGVPEVERKANVVDYSSEGKLWFVGVNARVSRMSGPQEMLPLQLVITNKTAGPARLTREGFVLETPDGKRLPVIGYAQFNDEYSRDRADISAGADYVERFTGRFPSPPFTWRELEFFPPRNTSTVPREEIETRDGELVHGYIYFARPSDEYVFPEGKYKLLFTPAPGEETFIVELFPF